MKHLVTALICGVFLATLTFAAHFTVMRWFSWQDKPMMPNFFTNLLLPGYAVAEVIPVPSVFRLGIAVAFDSVLFGIPVWLLLQISSWVSRS